MISQTSNEEKFEFDFFYWESSTLPNIAKIIDF